MNGHTNCSLTENTAPMADPVHFYTIKITTKSCSYTADTFKSCQFCYSKAKLIKSLVHIHATQHINVPQQTSCKRGNAEFSSAADL